MNVLKNLDEFQPKEQIKRDDKKVLGIIGILSGSGASAGHAIEGEMLQYLQNTYGANDDHDFPRYVVYNRPIKGFGASGIEDMDMVKKDFALAMYELDQMKLGDKTPQFIGIACNTLHSLLAEVGTLDAEVVNMVFEVSKKANSIGCKNVLVLSSYTTNQLGMYHNYLNQFGISTIKISKEHQDLLDQIIDNAIGGKQGDWDIQKINDMITIYQKDNTIDAVILGCTELPLAYNQSHTDFPVISSNNILATTLVDKAEGIYK